MLDRNLEIFIMVAERKSITETAHKMYISQPAVSQAIKNLEKKLNVRLFHRDKKRGILLTDIGKEILLYAERMAEFENQIYQAAYRENNFIGGKLRIASMPIMTTTTLSKVLPVYRERYPYVTVELYDGDPEDVQKMVEEHMVDFGISSEPFKNLEHETLIYDRMIGFFHPDDPAPDHINLKGKTDHLIFCDAAKKTTIELMEHGDRVTFEDCLIVRNAETVVSMVANRNGIGIISEYTLDSIPNNLPRCPVKPEICMHIDLIAHSFNDLTPVAKEFIKLLKESIQA